MSPILLKMCEYRQLDHGGYDKILDRKERRASQFNTPRLLKQELSGQLDL